jgi:hypothetical protein
MIMIGESQWIYVTNLFEWKANFGYQLTPIL